MYDDGYDCKVCNSTHIVWEGSSLKTCVRVPTLADSADKNLGTAVNKDNRERGDANYINRC